MTLFHVPGPVARRAPSPRGAPGGRPLPRVPGLVADLVSYRLAGFPGPHAARSLLARTDSEGGRSRSPTPRDCAAPDLCAEGSPIRLLNATGNLTWHARPAPPLGGSATSPATAWGTPTLGRRWAGRSCAWGAPALGSLLGWVGRRLGGCVGARPFGASLGGSVMCVGHARPAPPLGGSATGPAAAWGTPNLGRRWVGRSCAWGTPALGSLLGWVGRRPGGRVGVRPFGSLWVGRPSALGARLFVSLLGGPASDPAVVPAATSSIGAADRSAGAVTDEAGCERFTGERIVTGPRMS